MVDQNERLLLSLVALCFVSVDIDMSGQFTLQMIVAVKCCQHLVFEECEVSHVVLCVWDVCEASCDA